MACPPFFYIFIYLLLLFLRDIVCILVTRITTFVDTNIAFIHKSVYIKPLDLNIRAVVLPKVFVNDILKG